MILQISDLNFSCQNLTVPRSIAVRSGGRKAQSERGVVLLPQSKLGAFKSCSAVSQEVSLFSVYVIQDVCHIFSFFTIFFDFTLFLPIKSTYSVNFRSVGNNEPRDKEEEEDYSLLLDDSETGRAATDNYLNVNKDAIAEPLYTLLGEVFDLRGVFRWLRRSLITFVQITYGRTINR